MDRIPVLPPVQFYLANKKAKIRSLNAYKHLEKIVNAQVNFINECKFDGMDVGIDTLAAIEACGSKVSYPDYGVPFVVEPILKKSIDHQLLEIPDPRKDRRFQKSMCLADMIIDTVGNDLFTYATLCGPFTLAGELRGLDFLLADLHIDPKFALDLIKFSSDIVKEYIEESAKLSIDSIILADPTSSENFISESQFAQCVLPNIVKRTNQIKELGKTSCVHICGNSKNELNYLSSYNIDVLWIDLALSKILPESKKTTIMGNISCDLLSSNNPNRVFNESLRCIREMDDSKYILSGGCVLPLTGKIECIKMLRYASECQI